jgi:phosphocarrier protein
MLRRKIKIVNPDGLHLRPATVLCSRSIEFKSTITLKSGDKNVNAKSVLGVLSALIKYGDEVELNCEGPDEAEAMDVLSVLIEEGLDDTINK